MTILKKKYYNIFLNNFLFYLLALFLTLIPWLEFINSNYGELDNIINDNFVFLIILYLIFASLIYFFSKILFKKKDKLFHVSLSGIIIWIFFQFNLIKSIINKFFSETFIWHFSSEISLILIIGLIIFSVYLIIKSYNWSFFILFFLIFNFIYLSVSLFPKIDISNINNNKSTSQNLNTSKIYSNILDRPNIYFFLSDAMKPLNEFENFYKVKLDDFRNHYEKNNYEYYENTSNLYDWTEPVLTGFFTLEENIYTLESQNLEQKDKKLKSSIDKTFPALLKKEFKPKLLKELYKLGYDFRWVGNYSQNCSYTNYRYCLYNKKKDYIDFYTLQAFLNKSPLVQIFDNLIQLKFIQNNFKLKILHSNAIREIDEFIISNNKYIKDMNPTFFFIHEVEAHEPYFVDLNCNNKRFQGNYNLEGYKNSYLCVIKKITKVIKTLEKFDPNSIVIFQSDHSWIMSKKSENEFGNRNNIFNLVKSNKICKKNIPDNPNNINIVKYYIDCIKNQNL